ncbi:winged helix-turn-helix transcriptional regulator [Domibacillus sp. DTU_2020_1001157_1_SI_ALB_TIR_016]|uniref:winged helix-turn-helix transcriptional regulator n=1 Tax=Domibacillus sp. DTU_2020_1001157_1_SI_ALB_TIR_016 TaxID=3077789 RepID=UPI0028E3F209|nr:winged helix-turn-helix transcriptional regulator [Domibacillus sp. DTU_2020_1001157_1_SI_ALB_TIR_016]WNS80885.1 winged helix-turn-helix transcriptional regulator [Domibacillus sp. DTU_2020_1001157_1_SI_ALB_TIR_016]
MFKKVKAGGKLDYKDQVCIELTPLEMMVGKWKPIIVLHLIREGTKRFSELQKLIPEINKRTLTLHLRELEEQDIVQRVVFPEVPPRVEYSITEHGKTLHPVLLQIYESEVKRIGDTEAERDISKIFTALEARVGKWKPILLLHLLKGGTKRFNELHKLVPDISKRMLTVQLRELESRDIVLRVVYPQVPPKVEYSITEHGRELQPVLEAMHTWGKAHIEHMKNKAFQ